MEIEEIAGETETEVNERVVFATMEREVWSNGQIITEEEGDQIGEN